MSMLKRRSLLLSLALPALSRARPAADELLWTDSARQRRLPLRLRLPEGSGTVPLVLFSHGLGGNLDAGSDWAEAWAQSGIATLHLQHPGSDTGTLREGGLRGLRAAASGEQLQARALDVRFVLDELQRRGAEFPRLNLAAIGLAGHSFGAHTTLAVAGQFAALADPRPLAFAAFSPSPPRRGAGFEGVRRPVLCLTGSEDGNPLGEEKTGAYRRGAYEALPPGDKAELWLDGADHMSFGGQQQRRRGLRPRAAGAAEQAERHRRLIAAISSDWWRAQLLKDDGARQRLAGRPAGLGAADDWRRG